MREAAVREMSDPATQHPESGGGHAEPREQPEPGVHHRGGADADQRDVEQSR